MNNAEDWIIVGRFGRVHGIKGLITIHSYTEPRENILQYTPLYARINKQWQLLDIVNVEITGKHILAQIKDFSDRDQVASLTNVEIGIQSEQLPELTQDEYYWHQLMGMQVVNQQGEILGTVVDILATGSNDVLIVEGEKRQLIPYLPDRSIIAVKPEERQIVVNWDVDF